MRSNAAPQGPSQPLARIFYERAFTSRVGLGGLLPWVSNWHRLRAWHSSSVCSCFPPQLVPSVTAVHANPFKCQLPAGGVEVESLTPSDLTAIAQVRQAELRVGHVAPALLAPARVVDDVVRQPGVFLHR